MYKVLRKILFKFDPEKIHHFAASSLSIAGKIGFVRTMTSWFFDYKNPMLKTEVAGLKFENPLGLAAGFDKNCSVIEISSALGFGHDEVGAITMHAQPGNDKPRIFRLVKDHAIINRMGFNNFGADKAYDTLKKVKYRRAKVGLNIGKSKITSLEEAEKDYLYTYKKLYDLVDFMTINVSSPNTPNLRKLQDKDSLLKIANALQKENRKKKPLFIKISPDLTFEQVDDVLEVCKSAKISGIIATNTTVKREGLKTEINETGGLSGLPLKRTSTEFIRYIYKKTNGRLPIIGVGGIFTARDAYEKITAGASLLQVYTGFIYEGPCIAKKINKGLVNYLKKDGFRNIQEAVGSKA